MILVSLIAITSKFLLVKLKRCRRSSKKILREHEFIWNRDRDLLLSGISMLCISSMSQYLDEEIFSNSLLLSGVALLNWFTKSSILEDVFNDNELVCSFSGSFY